MTCRHSIAGSRAEAAEVKSRQTRVRVMVIGIGASAREAGWLQGHEGMALYGTRTREESLVKQGAGENVEVAHRNRGIAVVLRDNLPLLRNSEDPVHLE